MKIEKMENHLNKKQAGIWMDHVEAMVINPYSSPSSILHIHSDHETHLRIPGESGDGMKLGAHRSTNNEYAKHSLEQHDLTAFFKKLAEASESFDELYIFGPGTAQLELVHYFEKDKRFNHKLLSTAPADYMNENLLAQYVRDFFEESPSSTK